jgi:formylglycine-generating enzyme required for sulfatase activity
LEQQCGERLGQDDVLLRPDAIALLDQLSAETGETPAVVAWRQRAAMLAGPPAPAWASASASDAHGPRAILSVPGEPVLPIAFRHVPPGRFRIGSSPSDPQHGGDEVQVDISLSRSRWMAETEVTQALWQRIMAGNPSLPKGDDLPVNRVSWHQVHVFLERFSAHTGVRARLPSEAEWEYACRAGDLDPAFVRGEAAAVERAAWYRANSDDGSHATGRRPPNALGLHDMLGNVWEWCEDRYGLYPATGATDPQGGERDERVVRGGCWSDPLSALRAANRAAVDPGTASSQIGFRLVIDGE